MTYNLFICREGARERFGDESFATQDSALAFALEYFPEHVDFEIEESSAHSQLAVPQIGTSASTEISNVISLCDYRRSKHGIAV